MPTSDWKVRVQDVGSRLRARTVDDKGNELGTFTDATRPTAEQVNDLLIEAVGRLADTVGPDLPERYWPQARALAAMDAASDVEMTYFPEEVASGRSPYQEIRDLYKERLAEFKEAISEAGSETEDEVGGAGSPSYGFPNVAGGLVGWDTNF